MFCIYVKSIPWALGKNNSTHNNPVKRCFLWFNSSSPADAPRQSSEPRLSACGKWWDFWHVATNSWCQTLKKSTGRRKNQQTSQQEKKTCQLCCGRFKVVFKRCWWGRILRGHWFDDEDVYLKRKVRYWSDNVFSEGSSWSAGEEVCRAHFRTS